MTIEEVKDYINSSTEYDFLRDYPHKIAFLTLGGSYPMEQIQRILTLIYVVFSLVIKERFC